METDKEGTSSKILGDLCSVIYSVSVFHIIVFVLLFRIDLVFVMCVLFISRRFPTPGKLIGKKGPKPRVVDGPGGSEQCL
jgi:hypothetical protein